MVFIYRGRRGFFDYSFLYGFFTLYSKYTRMIMHTEKRAIIDKTFPSRRFPNRFVIVINRFRIVSRTNDSWNSSLFILFSSPFV